MNVEQLMEELKTANKKAKVFLNTESEHHPARDVECQTVFQDLAQEGRTKYNIIIAGS